MAGDILGRSGDNFGDDQPLGAAQEAGPTFYPGLVGDLATYAAVDVTLGAKELHVDSKIRTWRDRNDDDDD